MKKMVLRTTCLVVMLMLGLMLGACAPTFYQRPVENFEASTQGARKVYFSQLKSGHESFLVRQEIKLKLDILTDEKYNYDSENYIDQKDKIANLKSEDSIPKESLKIRQGAFEVLEYYGKTLQTLASDEKTDALKTELSGLSEDLGGLLKTTEKLTAINEGFKFLQPVAQWVGPLGSAVEIINGLVDLASDYFREKAIKQAILKSDATIKELLTLFQDEAMNAATFQKNNYEETLRECKETKKISSFPGSAEEFIAHDFCFGVEIKIRQLPKIDELEEVFKLVRQSQSELKKLAEGGDFDDIVERIRHFKNRIEYIKTKFEILMDN